MSGIEWVKAGNGVYPKDPNTWNIKDGYDTLTEGYRYYDSPFNKPLWEGATKDPYSEVGKKLNEMLADKDCKGNHFRTQKISGDKLSEALKAAHLPRLK